MTREGNTAVNRVYQLVNPFFDPKSPKYAPQTGERARQLVYATLNWALGNGWILGGPEKNAASMWEGAPLRKLLPLFEEFYKPTPHAAWPHKDMPQLITDLRAYTWTRDKFSPWNDATNNRFGTLDKNRCGVCQQPQRAEIEEAYDLGISDRKIAARFDIGRISVRTHALHVGKPIEHIRRSPLMSRKWRRSIGCARNRSPL
jgi:hypothetical protein